MHALVDLEIVRSALLSGEINDALSRMSRTIRKCDGLYALTKKEKYLALGDLMKKIRSAITEKGDPGSILGVAQELEQAGFVQFDEHDAEEYLKNLVYYITIMKQRYEISSKGFDPRRCGDL